MILATQEILEFTELGFVSVGEGFLITLSNYDGETQQHFVESKRQLVRFINKHIPGRSE